jgi:hypothetical protein
LNTCVALVGAYLRFNGYITVPEQPVLVGEGKPYRYHTATDVDILAVRFPNAAVVVPREYGSIEDDLHLEIDDVLELHEDTVDVLIGEVKSGRPRLNEGLRDASVLYATIRRVDPGFDVPVEDTIQKLIRRGEAECKASGKKWRFRLVAFGEGQPALEGGPYMVVQMRHVAAFLMQTMREHHQVWKDAQFGDPVLDLLHHFDKMGFTWKLSERDVEGNPPTTEPNAQPDELAQKVARKPKQNEKIAHPTKPRAKNVAAENAAKNGKSSKPRKTPRRRITGDDGWIPGGG